jgi:biotin-dependent carboxylase-like uncharacterized protein
MTASFLHILSGGLATTVQDLGRPGYAQLGVPAGGALDPVSLRAANALAGIPPDVGALEIVHTGPSFAVEAHSVRMSFAGADANIDLSCGPNSSEARPIETMRSIRLVRGDIVSIGALSGGALLYIAVEGGFAIEPVLGSLSTYIRGGFGGWYGRGLIAGDRLPLRRESAGERHEHRLAGLDVCMPTRLRVVDGPQIDRFTPSDIAAFFDSEYAVASADRMGMRLRGPKLNHVHGHDVISEGIAPGSIRIAGNGEPIVLLADRQTTGGYPKIATVISADLPALGRLSIGARIGFERVSMEDAAELRRKLFAQIDGISGRLVRIDGAAERAPDDLLQLNLISGVIDARI